MKQSPPTLRWPKTSVQCPATELPAAVKTWVESVLDRPLYDQDRIDLHLLSWRSDDERRRQTEAALRSHGLTEDQLQEVIRVLPG